MFQSHCVVPAAGTAARLKPLAALVLGLMLAGCGSTKGPSGPQVFSWSFLDEPVVQRPVAPLVKRDLEDDGLPSQEAPGYRVRQTQDDPSQPWSRNYGRAPGDVDEIDPADVTPAPEKLAVPESNAAALPAESSEPVRLIASRSGISRCISDGNGGWRCAD